MAFVHAKQRLISTRIASLYGSQPSSVVLCMQNSEISIRITSLYWSQTSPVALCMQNSVLSDPESLVSMVPSPHLWFCACKTAPLWIRITSLYGSQTSPVVLCMQNNVISIRNTSLYGSQPSPVVFACKTTATLGSELQVSMGPRPHLLVL